MSSHVLGQLEIAEMHCSKHKVGYLPTRCTMLHHVVLSKLDALAQIERPAATDRSGTHVLMGRHKITFENTLKKGKHEYAASFPNFELSTLALAEKHLKDHMSEYLLSFHGERLV